MKATPRRILNWHLISSLLLVLGCTGPSRANAAQILFVINSVLDPATTANALDQEVRDRLVAQGHTVTLADDDTVSAGDLTGKDLVLISSSVASGAPGVNPLTRNITESERALCWCVIRRR